MIAEKFQPLVAAGAIAYPGKRRDMGQRLLHERSIGKAIADPLFDRGRAAAAPSRLGGASGRGSGRIRPGGRGRRSGARALGSWPWAHLTSLKNRSQRAVHGQVHISHACTLPSIEKKMIWARPMMFSNGTYPTSLRKRLSWELSRLSP